jgi:lactobin A/cerein 7B family class IIb bacteriocin
MAHIQMTDGNSSDLGLTEELTNEELTNEELTDEELSEIDGGGVGALGGGVGGAATSIFTDTFNRRPINWSSAAAGGLGGAIGGGITGGIVGAFGGPLGSLASASLAGED